MHSQSASLCSLSSTAISISLLIALADAVRYALCIELEAQAVGISRPGGPEVLSVVDVLVREPRANEVRVAVHAAAISPADIILRQGGIKDIDPPWIPGMDASGVVESVGGSVNRVAVGSWVMAAVSARRLEGGAQVQFLVIPAASVVPIPPGMSPEEAAVLPMNGLTALSALEELGLKRGQTLAVSGGAGMVASYVIGLAKERGLVVLADASPKDEALVQSFGVDVVLPRGADFPDLLLAEAPHGVDAICDTALLGPTLLPALRDGGRLAVLRGWPHEDPDRGIVVLEIFVNKVLERTDLLEEVRLAASEGVLRARVASTYALDQIADGHRALEAGGVRGRPVVRFTDAGRA